MAKARKTSSARGAATHVALLRGINVGGKNMLPMAELVELFTAAGCADVQSYIQSGNVVFRADAKLARRIGDVISAKIAAGFELDVPLVLRSAAELAAVAAGNPFLKRGVAPETLHVAFLGAVPERARAASLDPGRSPGDSFELRGRELYLHLPNGAGKTKLTNAYLDSRLATTSTLRNWRTVLKLLEMTRAG